MKTLSNSINSQENKKI